MPRLNNRSNDKLRQIDIQINVNKYAEGSCLISFGNTKVLCTATIDNKLPPFLKGSKSGWITAEYGMLPRSTHDRMEREASKGKQSGRTQEIQRLIGRSLRAIINLELLGERQIKIDCDVLQADGGTRVASICGGYVALFLACQKLLDSKIITTMPITEAIGAISCGIINDEAMIDLDYIEDSNAQSDANFVMTSSGKIVEIQICAEKKSLTKEEFDNLYFLASEGIHQVIKEQQKAILQNKFTKQE
jgi:ribonuclease PH